MGYSLCQPLKRLQKGNPDRGSLRRERGLRNLLGDDDDDDDVKENGQAHEVDRTIIRQMKLAAKNPSWELCE